jgi:hypothetical protein
MARHWSLASVLTVAFALSISAAAERHDEPSLRRLAERLVGVWGVPGEMRVELHVGSVPDDAPVTLPLAAGFDLVGSLARYDRAGTLVSLQVVLDGPVRPVVAFQAQRAAFERAGWHVVTEAGMVGFMPTQMASFGRACAPEPSEGARAIAFVNASSLPGGPSDVRIELNAEAWEGACLPDPGGERLAPLPALQAPEGALVEVPVVMHDVEAGVAIAIVRDAPDPRDLVAHYEREIAALGWTRRQGDAAADLSGRSRWAFEGEDGRAWLGVFAAEWATVSGPITVSFTVLPDPASP